LKEFFSVIVRLHKGKSVSISEIIGLQEFTKRKMDGLEELILQGMKLKSPGSSNAASVRVSDRVRRMMSHQEEEEKEMRERSSVCIQKAEKIRKNWIRSYSADSHNLFTP